MRPVGTVLSAIELTVPDDFPAKQFEAVHNKLATYDGHTYSLSFDALRAIAYRFIALADYDESFTASIKQYGISSSHAIRYNEDRDLFGFFSNGFSVFEAFWFALFAIGAFPPQSSRSQLRRMSRR
jgi:hypothetical protein